METAVSSVDRGVIIRPECGKTSDAEPFFTGHPETWIPSDVRVTQVTDLAVEAMAPNAMLC